MSTERTTLHRHPERGSHDWAEIESVLDEGLFCHVGFVDDGPVVIPSNYGRMGKRLILHGSPASRMMKTLRSGRDVSIAVTLLDGLVLDASAFDHSMNYRSVVIFGRGTEVTDPAEKRAALDAIVEHIVPGRLPHLRPMTDKEINATMVVSIPIDEASIKTRTGPPTSGERWPVWTGVIPTRLTAGVLRPLVCDAEAPDHVAAIVERLSAT